MLAVISVRVETVAFFCISRILPVPRGGQGRGALLAGGVGVEDGEAESEIRNLLPNNQRQRRTCATYCTPCRPRIREFSGWIRTPPRFLCPFRPAAPAAPAPSRRTQSSSFHPVLLLFYISQILPVPRGGQGRHALLAGGVGVEDGEAPRDRACFWVEG